MFPVFGLKVESACCVLFGVELPPGSRVDRISWKFNRSKSRSCSPRDTCWSWAPAAGTSLLWSASSDCDVTNTVLIFTGSVRLTKRKHRSLGWPQKVVGAAHRPSQACAWQRWGRCAGRRRGRDRAVRGGGWWLYIVLLCVISFSLFVETPLGGGSPSEWRLLL